MKESFSLPRSHQAVIAPMGTDHIGGVGQSFYTCTYAKEEDSVEQASGSHVGRRQRPEIIWLNRYITKICTLSPQPPCKERSSPLLDLGHGQVNSFEQEVLDGIQAEALKCVCVVGFVLLCSCHHSEKTMSQLTL